MKKTLTLCALLIAAFIATFTSCDTAPTTTVPTQKPHIFPYGQTFKAKTITYNGYQINETDREFVFHTQEKFSISDINPNNGIISWSTPDGSYKVKVLPRKNVTDKDSIIEILRYVKPDLDFYEVYK